MDNLALAFPEKPIEERKKLAKEFYSHFIDTFIEAIKLLSISDKALAKRCTINIDAPNALAIKGKSIQFHCGHQMNWELASRVFSKNVAAPWVVVYKPISNKIFDRLFYKLRTKDGAVFVSTTEYRSRMHEIFRKQYALALAADQNPWDLNNAYWLYFFNKATPFLIGPDKGAIKKNTAVVFMDFIKVKRGYYHFETKVVTENAAEMKPGELTKVYRDFLETVIRRDPSNYLWSHRRWKHTFDANNKVFIKNWIDDKAPPVS